MIELVPILENASPITRLIICGLLIGIGVGITLWVAVASPPARKLDEAGRGMAQARADELRAIIREEIERERET